MTGPVAGAGGPVRARVVGSRVRVSALAALLALACWLIASEALQLAGSGATAQPHSTPSSTAAALGPISAALAAGDPAYRLSRVRDTVRGYNPAQHVTLLATGNGVTLRSRSVEVGLRFDALGFGGALTPTATALPSSRSNRLTFDRGTVREWYVNGPLGVEQGFTVLSPPSGDARRPLSLALTLSGDARAALAPHGRGITFAARGSRLAYGALSATDASGRTLPVALALHGHRILLSVDARGARYPLTIDPLVHQQAEAELGAADEEGEGSFGYSVALSADGNTALVGGPRDGTYGAVWVFVRSGGHWTQQGPKLQGGEKNGSVLESCGDEVSEEGEECNFGRSVALSADGNTALVGNPRESRLEAPSEPGGPSTLRHNVGAAWVYTRSGSSWTLQARLTGAEELAAGRFGKSVALSADGSTALVGGTADRADRGSAWVFTRSGEGWSQDGPKLVPNDEQGEGFFGQSVALADDGATAVIGAPGDSEYTGAAWIFGRSESIWFQHGSKLTGAGESGPGRFGYAVAMSGDGTTALVGARSDGEGAGAAWPYTRTGSTWSPQGTKLTGGGEGAQSFGFSVALSRDGSTALVGAPRDGGYRGAAWQFQRSGGTWSGAEDRLEAGVSAIGHPWFGAGVAMSADGATRLVGGPRDNRVGAGWVFGSGPAVLAVSPSSGPRAGGTEVTISGSNLTGVTAVHFGASDAPSFKVLSPETLVATTPAGEGSVEVTVTSPFGTSLGGVHFRYLAASKTGGGTDGSGSGGVGSVGSSGLPAGGLGVLGVSLTGAGTCRVALSSRNITVLAHNRAAFRLRVTGAGRCAGKLRLRVTRRIAHRRVRVKTIGTAVFSIPAGRSAVIRLKLNATGRRLLRTHHWRLSASLLLVRQSPAPALAQASNVRLARPNKHTAKHA